MSFDLAMFASKLLRYRQQFQVTTSQIADATGIPNETVLAYEQGVREPSGDHILIIADYFKCDFKFFISNERLAPFEQTENLFRKHEGDLSASDRWAIQEFLFLCECEETLYQLTNRERTAFDFQKTGTFLKRHGHDAAVALRHHLGHTPKEIGLDIYSDLRRIGVHVFRRELSNPMISGVFVRHPSAGRCILVNYAEDIYRQRFTAAHEAGHAILDDGNEINVSFVKENRSLVEVRANAFASRYLLPPEFLRKIPNVDEWTPEKAIDWASRLKVSTTALAYALKDDGNIDDDAVAWMTQISVPGHLKVDPELPDSLSPAVRRRKESMLKKGLSSAYVRLCFQAFREGHVSAGRLSEMLLVETSNLHTLANLYGEGMPYGD